MALDDHPFRIGFLVHDVARLRRTVFDKALRATGVTRSQWWLLANLSRHHDGGMMQTKLANVMDVGKVTLGGLIDRLEVSGLVQRKGVPGDRRAKLVVMTPRGRSLLTEMQSVASGVNAQVLRRISAEDIGRAESVLFRMKQELVAMDAVPRGNASPAPAISLVAPVINQRRRAPRLQSK